MAQLGPRLHCLPLFLFFPLPRLRSAPWRRRGRLACFVRLLMHTQLVQVVAFSALAASIGMATGSLDFKAGEYGLNMAVSLESHSIVGPIRFTSPSAKEPAVIQQRQFKFLQCDTTKQRFQAEFVNPGDPALPKSFKVIVKGDKGTLSIEGKRISFLPDWVVQ